MYTAQTNNNLYLENKIMVYLQNIIIKYKYDYSYYFTTGINNKGAE